MSSDNTRPHNMSQANSKGAGEAAANIVRHKLDTLYANEPDPREEILDAEEAATHRSKHQEFMYALSTSGKSLAEIQTAWHDYYSKLPDREKHKVWQEFYQAHGKSPHVKSAEPKPEPPKHKEPRASKHATAKRKPVTPRSVADVKEQLLNKVGARGKLSKKHHVQSILFGISMGAIMFIILIFGFFNERFIAPFISPSRNVSSTPIIVDQNATAVGSEPKIIIPKINVEIPVVYDEPSIEEKAIQNSLEKGVVHYATTPNPGEKGNAVIVGHSSNNILNKGKYKFAFVLLKNLEVGDTFILQKDGKQYVYKVYEKKVVKPDDVSVLGNTDKPSTVTLITCDPPGTSINRLIVVGEQISPDPNTNTTSTAVNTDQKPAVVPGNSQSLWARFKSWLSS